MFLSLRTVKNSITFKFLLPVILLVCGAISLMGGLAAQRLTSALEERAASQASTALEMCQQEMALTDRLVSKQVMMALRLIKARSAQEYGEPSAAGTTTFQGHEVTDLRLGGKSVANTTSLVDEVSGITEATATVFALSGKDFIRIATSVRKPNGERAVGTLLDPSGTEPRHCVLRNGGHSRQALPHRIRADSRFGGKGHRRVLCRVSCDRAEGPGRRSHEYEDS